MTATITDNIHSSSHAVSASCSNAQVQAKSCTRETFSTKFAGAAKPRVAPSSELFVAILFATSDSISRHRLLIN